MEKPDGTVPGYPEHWEADVVLRDGGTAHIRPIRPDDAERLVEFYAEVSDESKYFRFFAPYPRLSDRDVHRFTHHDYVDRVGLAATVGDEFIAVVRYDRLPNLEDTAEVAFLVQDAHQGRGVASALLEHISAAARERGIRRFDAEVLPENRRMVKVFTDAGYTQRRSFGDGVVSLELDLEPTDTQLEVMRAREHRAEARSVHRLLDPRSVAVVGAGRGPDGLGRTLLRNLLAGGFTGDVFAVNRAFAGQRDAELEGVPAVGSVELVPRPLDLAVLAVPAAEVPDVAAACGAHGVQGLVVAATGWADAGAEGLDRQRALVRLVRAHGMRLVGPAALGLINTDPEVRLNASLAPHAPDRGGIGLFTQSPAIALAALSAAHRRRIGLSSFVSSGNRADVSGNDLLQFWEEDPRTDVACLYLESFGNPRKFTRLARRVARVKPVVVVKAGRHPGTVPTGHAVSDAPIADSTVDTLFRQAGVIRVDTLPELWDAAELLHHQPLPDGERVAVVGNSESVGLLTEDACIGAGLRPITRQVPSDADGFAAALRAAVESPGHDAVLAVAVPAFGDAPAAGPAGALLGPPAGADPGPLLDAVASAADRARELGKPLLLVHMAFDGLSELLRRHGADGSALRAVPAYPAPERAARALAEAVRYAAWRRTEQSAGTVPDFDDFDEPTARTLIRDALRTAAPHPGAAAAQPPGAAGRDAGEGSGGTADRSAADAARGVAGREGDAAVQPSAADGSGDSAAGWTRGAAGRQPGEEAGSRPRPRPATDAGAQPPGAVARQAGEDPSGAADRAARGPGSRGGDDAAQPSAAGVGAVALDSAAAGALLGAYGVRVWPAVPAPDGRAAVAAAGEVGGFPVALKTTAPALRHRADLGGVRLDLTDEAELLRAHREMTEALGGPAAAALAVQAMAPRGVPTAVAATVDPAVGAVLSFGLAGAPSELLGDIAHRLLPATDREVAALVRGIRGAPLLLGHRGADPVDTDALEDVLLRLSVLVHDLPEVVSVRLEPVVVARRGVAVLDAEVRLAPAPARTDLGPRTLRGF
ncbi:hypothetical protein BIV57_17535 [Mangrovactinospora gilvigrisea]|uniref:N-acetyltransferase domain-containing protein n=1 Tax=Mangrovactinospora gilvigrisea TaxID=1428644 RepID=A0A1J7BC43_9ACTN|nr:GNAT family N-acetyltransferase [Mangrovactinospora gilvigrisea]OIV36206.1 hypothetical protein BIV57_17535 [Mangrovactinospora gilvigrisea]